METITIKKRMTAERTIVLTDLPLEPGDEVEIEVRLPSSDERPKAPGPIDWSRLAGTLKTVIDPIEYQERIRGEWDDRS